MCPARQLTPPGCFGGEALLWNTESGPETPNRGPEARRLFLSEDPETKPGPRFNARSAVDQFVLALPPAPQDDPLLVDGAARDASITH